MNNLSGQGALHVQGQRTPRVQNSHRVLGLPLVAWVTVLALAAVIAGGTYSIWLARNAPPPPSLPAGPPHALALARSSTTDILQGNYITTTALYRSTEKPSAVIAYYRGLLHTHTPQFGQFQTIATTTDPTRTPATGLQYMPQIFDSPTAADSTAARYVYTEYSTGTDDVAVAIDMRHQRGPTLVYMEMLTQPPS